MKHHGADVVVDWRRVQLFAAIVERVDNIRTASPRWLDESSETIGYEWLNNLQPALSRDLFQLEDLMARVGRALACFHAVPPSTFQREGSFTTPLSIEGISIPVNCGTINSGFFWGDCWHGNIFTNDQDQLVFIDPLPNRWLFPKAVYWTNGAIDLAMCHMSLFFCHTMLESVVGNLLRYLSAGERLLDSYLEVARAPRAKSSVLQLSRVLAERYIAAYRVRLPQPVAVIKQKLSLQVLKQLDAALSWRS